MAPPEASESVQASRQVADAFDVSLAIIVPTYRPGPPDETTWDDVRVCLASVAAYARGIEVVVAWDGPMAPENLPHNPQCRVIERPKGLKSGTGCLWACQQTTADELLVVSDDVVLHPTTVTKLLEDVALITSSGYQIGMLACRSNFAPNMQNIRAANGGAWGGGAYGYDTENTVFRSERVSPFCAYLSRQASDICGAVDLEWYSDDIACFDLVNAGFTNWISRSYVHHVGMRSSIGATDNAPEVMDRMRDESLAWIRVNRPDFWQHLVNTGQVAAEEREPTLTTPVRSGG
jgi:hypothetical protein